MTLHRHCPARTRPAPRIERATGRHPLDQHETDQGDLMTSTTPTAGGILAAADALQDPTRATFTREQVAYLMHLAYDAGRTATYLDDIARLHCTWADNADLLRQTYEQRVADEMAAMDAAGQARAAREGRPYRPHPGGPVDWETGQPIRTARHLEVAA